MKTRERIYEIITDVLEIPTREITDHSRIIEDFGATSLDIVNLIWRIEEAFALPETPESKLDAIETVAELIALVTAVRSDETSEVSESFHVVIASDHAGVGLKSELVSFLKKHGYSVLDLGPNDTSSVDYPDFARVLGTKVVAKEAEYGVLICGTGVGMSIAANKVRGVRAALISDTVSAGFTRQHNDANVICLGARIIGSELAKACLLRFLKTGFDAGDDGRHARRVALISEIEA